MDDLMDTSTFPADVGSMIGDGPGGDAGMALDDHTESPRAPTDQDDGKQTKNRKATTPNSPHSSEPTSPTPTTPSGATPPLYTASNSSATSVTSPGGTNGSGANGSLLRRSGTRERKRRTFSDDYEADDQFKEKPTSGTDPELAAPNRKRQKTGETPPKDKEKEKDPRDQPEKVKEKEKEPQEEERASPPPQPAPTPHKSKHSEKSHSKHKHHAAQNTQGQPPPGHTSKAEQIYPLLLNKMNTIETLLDGSLKTLQLMVENMQSDVRQGLQSLQDRVIDTNHEIASKLMQLQRYQTPMEMPAPDPGQELLGNHFTVHQQPSPLVHQGFDPLSGPVDSLYPPEGDDGREDL